jgi:hypothetical protein
LIVGIYNIDSPSPAIKMKHSVFHHKVWPLAWLLILMMLTVVNAYTPPTISNVDTRESQREIFQKMMEKNVDEPRSIKYPADFSVLNGVPIHSIFSTSTYKDTSRSALPLCRENEHIQGKWKRVNVPLIHKDFFCCGWDWSDFQANRSACGIMRFGREMPFFFSSNTRYTHTGGNACFRDKNARTSVSKREQYVWEPDTCQLLPWDGKQFCELLGRRRIVLAGDSTMEQHIATLGSMIYDHQGGCADRLVFVRTEHLSKKGHMMPAADILQIAEPDILIISAGPHFHSLAHFQEAIQAVNETILPIIKQVPHAKVIFRGQHPGHVECNKYAEPLTNFTISTVKDRYDWNLHPLFDQELEKLVKNFHHHRISYWNTYPLYLRPDAHSYAAPTDDCLHYALPGALSFESNLLLTKLSTGEV